jgi:hypothetical protein
MSAEFIPTRTFHVRTSFTPTFTSISLNHLTTTLALLVVLIFTKLQRLLQILIDAALAFMIDTLAFFASLLGAGRACCNIAIYSTDGNEFQTSLVSAEDAEMARGLVDWEFGFEVCDQVSREMFLKVSEVERGATAGWIVFFCSGEGERGGYAS